MMRTQLDELEGRTTEMEQKNDDISKKKFGPPPIGLPRNTKDISQKKNNNVG